MELVQINGISETRQVKVEVGEAARVCRLAASGDRIELENTSY